MPSLRAHIALWIAVAPACGSVGCTLLARFDDMPPLDDGGLDATTGTDASSGDDGDSSTLIDADTDGSSRLDARADADAGPYAPCEGLLSGTYCGDDGLHGYQGSPGDLVRCDGGAIAQVVACDAGCLALSNPFPDTCNGCNTKANGSYCGRDFSVFPATDSDWLIQCQLGNAVQKVACAHGCTSNGANSTCIP